MKKLYACLLLLVALSGCASAPEPSIAADAAHNSRNSLDWAGTYRGVLPCASCEGIETAMTLNPDGTYVSSARYLGEDGQAFTGGGAFEWDEDGNRIRLSGEEPLWFRVGENRLTQLRLDGSTITGVLAEYYVLTKISGGITGQYWKLVEVRGQAVGEMEREPHLILQAADGRVSGFAGCNGFMGSYTLDEQNARISFGQIAMTRMFCAAGMEVEEAFTQVLEEVDNYSLNGDSLTLNRARIAPLARFERGELEQLGE